LRPLVVGESYRKAVNFDGWPGGTRILQPAYGDGEQVIPARQTAGDKDAIDNVPWAEEVYCRPPGAVLRDVGGICR
jgi:hypothetical protein